MPINRIMFFRSNLQYAMKIDFGATARRRQFAIFLFTKKTDETTTQENRVFHVRAKRKEKNEWQGKAMGMGMEWRNGRKMENEVGWGGKDGVELNEEKEMAKVVVLTYGSAVQFSSLRMLGNFSQSH